MITKLLIFKRFWRRQLLKRVKQIKSTGWQKRVLEKDSHKTSVCVRLKNNTRATPSLEGHTSESDRS
jgi:hypothetical protein